MELTKNLDITFNITGFKYSFQKNITRNIIGCFDIHEKSKPENYILYKAFCSSFEIIPKNVEALDNLLSKINDVISGKEEEIILGFGGDGFLKITQTEVEAYDDNENEGIIKIEEFLHILKEWRIFLEEYYKHAFVPIDWIKPEYLDQAKERQKPAGV